MSQKLYKVLGESGKACHGGYGTWSLPTRNGDGTWTPGEWMPIIEGELVPCTNGYHLCRRSDLVQWLGPTIYEAEYRGEMVEDDNKVVVREARLLRRIDTWNERTARLFACDCAERTVHITNDERCKNAIAVARRYANGEASSKELAAAGTTARAAAGATAWAAAGATAWAAWDAALDAARDAAWDAARDAAWAAARDAAWAAAWAAARDAARDAAWAAARDAARDAAWDAAWAAGDAARADEREWQTARLMEYLEEGR